MAEYAEHSLVTTFKFGLIYQKFGQVSEEALFGNRTHSPAMEEFMQLLGQVISLSDHQGYRGGLDTKHGQTGEHALYETFRGCEVIFHVSTLLPYVDNDPQQLQRKCHIGNDILAIVFQDTNTPFCPDMIASHFLHAYIVVQAIDPCSANTRYKVSVSSRGDVPTFGPKLPSTAIFTKGKLLKEFLLAKLINGERACYKATKFYALHQRTRASLLENVTHELRMRTEEYVSSVGGVGGSGTLAQKIAPASTKLISKLTRKALGNKAVKGQQQQLHQQQQQQPQQQFVAPAASSCGTTSSSGSGSSAKPLRKYSSNGVLSVASSSTSSSTADKSSTKDNGSISTLMMSGTTNNNNSSNNNNNKTSIIIGGNGIAAGHGSTADSGHGDSDHSLASSPHLEEADSESDDGSDSADSIINENVGRHRPRHIRHHLRRPKKLATAKRIGREPSVVQLSPNYVLVPECRSVVSGAVTTINVAGDNLVDGQVAKLQEEVARLRVDKLELLRQILSVQHEVRRLQDREAQLQSDLCLAGKEIRRLKFGISVEECSVVQGRTSNL